MLSLVLAITIAFPPVPRLVWNASASSPVGLYVVTPGAPVGTGDFVIARLPARFRVLAARRRYLPLHVPLVKQVAAAQGARVCAKEDRIEVNDKVAVLRRRADTSGRVLPWWDGCRALENGELFLLGDNPGSFDSRYFGPVARGAILGRAWPLWIR